MKTGKPNVDWCESNKEETIRSNVIGALNLADVCHLRKVHLTMLGSGCVYQFDNEHPMPNETQIFKDLNDLETKINNYEDANCKGFKESDEQNFFGSFYSKTKGQMQKMIEETYPNVLLLRLRMPISSDLNDERSLLSKLLKYEKVVNIPNSITFVNEMMPLLIQMAKRNLKGVYNFTNPGVISHNQLLSLYKHVNNK